jgi:plastocyanin
MDVVQIAKKAAVPAMVLMLLGPGVGAAGGASGGGLELSMSNFRYCKGAACSPADVGYMRSSSGPVSGTDNPAAVIDVPEGATVRWVYRDTGPGSCDSFEQCPGHNVRVEDGSAAGAGFGAVRSRGGEAAITGTITQPVGEFVRYFCSINDHYQLGMTGVFRVVAR